jgi:hypothetical protein
VSPRICQSIWSVVDMEHATFDLVSVFARGGSKARRVMISQTKTWVPPPIPISSSTLYFFPRLSHFAFYILYIIQRNTRERSDIYIKLIFITSFPSLLSSSLSLSSLSSLSLSSLSPLSLSSLSLLSLLSPLYLPSISPLSPLMIG